MTLSGNRVDSGDGKQGLGKGFTKQKALIKVIFQLSKQTSVLFVFHCETRKSHTDSMFSGDF